MINGASALSGKTAMPWMLKELITTDEVQCDDNRENAACSSRQNPAGGIS
jgi:hypothetical protein